MVERRSAKLLDIIIPTCGRKDLLYGCLTSLSKNKRKSDFNIIVFHNPKDPRLDFDLKQFSRFGLNVFLEKSETFLPIDESMIGSLQYARSPYILWLGDDDRVIEEGVDCMLEIIETNSPDCIVLNMGATESELSEIRPRKNLASYLFYKDPALFFEEWVFDLPFGSFVFRRDQEAIQHSKHFFGTSHAYSGMLFYFLSKKYQNQGGVNIVVTSNAITYSIECPKSWSAYRVDILLNHIPRWLDEMKDYVGATALRAKQKYIQSISSTRFLLDLAAKSGLPHEFYYRTYLSWWKRFAFQLTAHFPWLYAVSDFFYKRYSKFLGFVGFK